MNLGRNDSSGLRPHGDGDTQTAAPEAVESTLSLSRQTSMWQQPRRRTQRKHTTHGWSDQSV